MYYLHNGHGDVTQLLNEKGELLKDYRYDAFGKEQAPESMVFGGKQSTELWRQEVEKIDNPFRYAGEYQDEETGNYYLRARYYDPSTQRFINEDSYGVEKGAAWLEHLYGYGNDNPLRYFDPTGHRLTEDGNGGGRWVVNVNGKNHYGGKKTKDKKPAAKEKAAIKTEKAKPVVNKVADKGTGQNIPKPHYTVAVGTGGSLAGGVGGTASVQGARDAQGNVVLIGTIGGGGGTPTVGWTPVQVTLTNANKVTDLLGTGNVVGMSANIPATPGLGIDYLTFGDNKGININIGKISPVPVEGHGYYTYSFDLDPSSKEKDSIGHQIDQQMNWLNKNLPQDIKNSINDYLGQNIFPN